MYHFLMLICLYSFSSDSVSFYYLQVLITDPEKLDGIRQRESDITKEKVLKILAAGTNVILCSGGIDDLCLKVRLAKCIRNVSIGVP